MQVKYLIIGNHYIQRTLVLSVVPDGCRQTVIVLPMYGRTLLPTLYMPPMDAHQEVFKFLQSIHFTSSSSLLLSSHIIWQYYIMS